MAAMGAGEEVESLDAVEEDEEDEEDKIAVERRREDEAAATDLAVATTVRGDAARRAGMDRASDRRAAMMDESKKERDWQ